MTVCNSFKALPNFHDAVCTHGKARRNSHTWSARLLKLPMQTLPFSKAWSWDNIRLKSRASRVGVCQRDGEGMLLGRLFLYLSCLVPCLLAVPCRSKISVVLKFYFCAVFSTSIILPFISNDVESCPRAASTHKWHHWAVKSSKGDVTSHVVVVFFLVFSHI